MIVDDDSRQAVANAVLQRWFADRNRGDARPLADYQAAFPGFEDVVAAELTPLLAGDQGAADGGGAVPGIGPYEIRRELGRGGQATVYLAFDPRLQREVALKVLPRGIASLQQELRLQREATTAARLDDSGICPVYDVGRDGEHVYLAMKYIAGETLAQRLDRQRRAGEPLAIGAVLELFERLCASLHRAHQAGVVHRDLKPANVMLDADGRPVLLDFGLAVAADDGDAPLLTRSGDVFGSPAWMPPERLLGHRSTGDVRGDVWAIGVCLYEALTLQRPFAAPTLDALYRAILNEEPVPLRRRRPDAPRALAAVLEVALAKAPERRYQTAADLAADLAAVRTGEPIRARPPGFAARLWRWHRRHAVAATAGWLLLAGLASTITIQRVLLGEVRLAQQETEQLNHFLVEKMLLSVTPQEARGHEITVAEIFDRAVQQVTASFREPSRVGGTLQHVIGVANKRLGRLPAARQCLEQALAVRTQVLGADDRATLTSRFELAQLTRQTDAVAVAERELLAVLAAQTANLGAADHDTLLTRQEVVRLQLQAGRAAAEPSARALLADYRRAFGDDDAGTLTAEHLLGRALADRGRREEAEPLMRHVLERRRALFGADAVAYGDSLNDLASLLHDLALIDGQARLWPEAAATYAEAVDYATRVHGRQSQAYATAINNQASLLQDRGRTTDDQAQLRQAVALFQESLALREAIDGPESSRVANVVGNLASAHADLREYAAAVQMSTRALAIRERVSGHLHTETLRALSNAMVSSIYAHENARALAMAQDLEERLAAATDMDPRTRLRLRHAAVSIYVRVHEPERALQDGEALWQECCAQWPDGGGPVGRGIAEQLSYACHELGRSEEEERWHERSGRPR